MAGGGGRRREGLRGLLVAAGDREQLEDFFYHDLPDFMTKKESVLGRNQEPLQRHGMEPQPRGHSHAAPLPFTTLKDSAALSHMSTAEDGCARRLRRGRRWWQLPR